MEHEIDHEGSLEMAAIQRLLHGLSDTPTDVDSVAKVDAIGLDGWRIDVGYLEDRDEAECRLQEEMEVEAKAD